MWGGSGDNCEWLLLKSCFWSLTLLDCSVSVATRPQWCLSPVAAAAPRPDSVWGAAAWRKDWRTECRAPRSPSPTHTASHSQQTVHHGSENKRTKDFFDMVFGGSALRAWNMGGNDFWDWKTDSILGLTCANMSSAVKLMLSSLSACSIALLFCSTRLSMASCSSWL